MYTYPKLLDEVNFLARCGAETGSAGITCDGRLIPYLFVGSHTGSQIIITAGIHAREHIGSYLVVRQAARALGRFQNHKTQGGVYFIPMLNPDGNEIIYKGINAMRRTDRALLAGILRHKNRGLYKANARGVDLNVNFDANWGTGIQNTRVPGIESFIGAAPFSEPETRALRDFTYAVRPAATVSYHAIGRELYWEFGQTGAAKARDRSVAEYLNERLGYKIVDGDGDSAGGYKDWCIQALGIPAFTIELVDGAHTHPFTDYALAKDDIARNLDLPERLLLILNCVYN